MEDARFPFYVISLTKFISRIAICTSISDLYKELIIYSLFSSERSLQIAHKNVLTSHSAGLLQTKHFLTINITTNEDPRSQCDNNEK